MWSIGRLQTDADRERVVDGVCIAGPGERESARQIGDVIKHLGPRSFVVRDAHFQGGPFFRRPRSTMSFLRGPMTRAELQRAVRDRG